MRIFFYVVLGIIVWYVGKRLWRGFSTPPETVLSNPPQRMVRCAHCGLHIPQPEALAQGETFFCCEAHQQRFLKERDV